MLKNYFLVTVRSLMKKKMFVFINILGMGLAVALCILAYINWSFRHEWDGDQPNAEKIYRVQFWHDVNGERQQHGVSPMPLADHIRDKVSDVTRFHLEYCNCAVTVSISDWSGISNNVVAICFQSPSLSATWMRLSQ